VPSGEQVTVRARLAWTLCRNYCAWLAGRHRPSVTVRRKTVEEHRRDVERLRQTVAARRGPVCLVKRGVGHEARSRRARPGDPLDLRPLDGVLDIDQEAGTAVVEPQVTMRQLVRAVAACGLAPAVIPEFGEITVGGAIQGLGAESSSHRHGLFHESVRWMDVVLGDGSLLRVSPTEHDDLWRALPGSYGSLAIVVRAGLGLVAGSSHVSVQHRRLDLDELLGAEMPAAHDFVDALCDRGDQVVVTTADLADGGPARRSRWYDEYYCERVMATGRDSDPEPMAFADYVFRYDRGAFWVAPSKLGRSPVSRLLFGGFATAANLFRLRRARQECAAALSSRLVQDCIMPVDRAAELVRLLREVTDGPLWLLPIRCGVDNLFGLTPGAWMNVGAYVRLDLPPAEVEAVNRRLERAVTDLGGYKVLHAEVFYDRERFAGIYDMETYERLRSTYRADGALAHIHDKLGITDGC
jgi:FAD/FMN-containing dehydrogenase